MTANSVRKSMLDALGEIDVDADGVCRDNLDIMIQRLVEMGWVPPSPVNRYEDEATAEDIIRRLVSNIKEMDDATYEHDVDNHVQEVMDALDRSYEYYRCSLKWGEDHIPDAQVWWDNSVWKPLIEVINHEDPLTTYIMRVES